MNILLTTDTGDDHVVADTPEGREELLDWLVEAVGVQIGVRTANAGQDVEPYCDFPTIRITVRRERDDSDDWHPRPRPLRPHRERVAA